MLSHRLSDFYRRFKMPVDEVEEFNKFRNRVYSAVYEVANLAIITGPTGKFFGYLVGTPDMNALNLLNSHFACEESLEGLFRNLELLFISLDRMADKEVTNKLYKAIEFVLEISPTIAVEITKGEQDIVFYPKGAELLDEHLVDDVLNGLGHYSNANNAYITALKLYLARDSANYRNLLDNLRVTLEELLHALLGNKKSLENQKGELLVWLNNHGINQRIITSYSEFLFGSYRFIQNEDVKHGQAQFSEVEVEYVLYMTGSLLRFLIKVKQQEQNK